jgi:hypothetical protein
MKKNLTTILAFALLSALMVSCNTDPQIKPDITGDSTMMFKIKNDIEQGKQVTTGYAWILWYLPVLFLVVAWGWKEFINKKLVKECQNCGAIDGVVANRKPQKKRKKPTAVQSAPSSTPPTPPSAS